MNKVDILLTIAIALCAFMLGMTVAFYMALDFTPPKYFAIHSRALNYTDKECYTKIDIELIVFGKVLDYDKK